jgi:hypothetical protein
VGRAGGDVVGMPSLWGKVQRYLDGLIIKWTWRFGGPRKVDKPTMLLEREWFTDKSTIGRLSIDDEFICFTLEDTCRREKVNGKTAIPSGNYEVTVDWSERFGKYMPHVLDVPGFNGIRIHSGNTDIDTLGCILVGMRRGTDVIYDSKKAYSIVLLEIQKRMVKGNVRLSIVGGTPQDSFKV